MLPVFSVPTPEDFACLAQFMMFRIGRMCEHLQMQACAWKITWGVVKVESSNFIAHALWGDDS